MHQLGDNTTVEHRDTMLKYQLQELQEGAPGLAGHIWIAALACVQATGSRSNLMLLLHVAGLSVCMSRSWAT